MVLRSLTKVLNALPLVESENELLGLGIRDSCTIRNGLNTADWLSYILNTFSFVVRGSCPTVLSYFLLAEQDFCLEIVHCTGT